MLVFYTKRNFHYGASLCRGYQIAEKLDSHCNPPIDAITADNTVIVVKRPFPELIGKVKKIYCDLVDGSPVTNGFVRNYPDVIIIVATPLAAECYKKRFPKHTIIWIPHHHCNFERQVRNRSEVKKIGYNGQQKGFPPELWSDFVEKVKPYGFECYRENEVRDRAKLCDYFMNIDISVSFRNKHLQAKPPTKLNNAGSFKIPTVAYPEPCFVTNHGGESHFVPASTIDEMVKACVRLRNEKQFYDTIAEKAWQDAQAYHIDEVMKYYRKLEE